MIIENILKPEEHILWQGKPLKAPLSPAINIIRSIALTTIAIFVLILIRDPNSPFYHLIERNTRGFVIIAIIFFIYMFIKSPFVQNDTKIAGYAITDQRVIILYNALLGKIRAFSLESINSIRIEKSLEGRQEIVFGEYKSKGLSQLLAKNSEMGKKGSPAPKFIDVINCEQPLKILSTKAVNATIYGVQIDKESDFSEKLVVIDQATLNDTSLENIIEGDEKILWRDSSSGIFFGAHGRTTKLIISVILCAFVLLTSYISLNHFNLYSLPKYHIHKLYLLGATFITAFNMLISLKRYLNKDPELGLANEYIVTDKRVIIIHNNFKRYVQTFRLQAIDKICIVKSIFGTADVFIGEYVQYYSRRIKYRGLVNNSELGKIDDSPPQFLSIKDAEGLKRTLEQYTQCQITSGYFER